MHATELYTCWIKLGNRITGPFKINTVIGRWIASHILNITPYTHKYESTLTRASFYPQFRSGSSTRDRLPWHISWVRDDAFKRRRYHRTLSQSSAAGYFDSVRLSSNVPTAREPNSSRSRSSALLPTGILRKSGEFRTKSSDYSSKTVVVHGDPAVVERESFIKIEQVTEEESKTRQEQEQPAELSEYSR